MSKSVEDIKFILQYTAEQYEKNGSYQPSNPVAYAQGLREVLELIEALSIQQEADAKDAARYRWLSERIAYCVVPDMGLFNKHLGMDGLIDTAMETHTDSEDKTSA
jgi:hypothetical protein